MWWPLGASVAVGHWCRASVGASTAIHCIWTGRRESGKRIEHLQRAAASSRGLQGTPSSAIRAHHRDSARHSSPGSSISANTQRASARKAGANASRARNLQPWPGYDELVRDSHGRGCVSKGRRAGPSRLARDARGTASRFGRMVIGAATDEPPWSTRDTGCFPAVRVPRTNRQRRARNGLAGQISGGGDACRVVAGCGPSRPARSTPLRRPPRTAWRLRSRGRTHWRGWGSAEQISARRPHPAPRPGTTDSRSNGPDAGSHGAVAGRLRWHRRTGCRVGLGRDGRRCRRAAMAGMLGPVLRQVARCCGGDVCAGPAQGGRT